MKIEYLILSLLVISINHVTLGFEIEGDPWDECRTEMGIKIEENRWELEDMKDPRVKCFNDCLFRRMGYKTSGELDVDTYIQNVQREIEKEVRYVLQMAKSMTKCRYLKVDDPCELADALQECEDTVIDAINTHMEKWMRK